jgi:hypothetical protein
MEHSGLKGQKWGVRRYQYENKTYTPEGNRRYRPHVGTDIAVGVTTTAVGAAWVGTMLSATNMAVNLSTLATTIATKTAMLGAEVVAGMLAIPTPILALTVPMAIMMAPTIISSGEDYIKSKFGG